MDFLSHLHRSHQLTAGSIFKSVVAEAQIPAKLSL